MELYKMMLNLKPSKAKGVSFSVFLLCVFIYIFIFYIFDISPSTQLNKTRFWFFISNTLILIIAADYGSFSSSKLNQEINYHNEESMSSQSQEARSNNTNYYHHNISPTHPSLLVSQQIPELMDKRIVVYNSSNQQVNYENATSEKIENNLRQMVGAREISPKPTMIEEELEGLDDNKDIQTRSMFGRSKSDIAIKLHADEDVKSTSLHRCESEKHERMIAHDDEVENELSNLSDEELNRRVEEFIQKFNAHLRLQAEATKSGHYM